MRVDVFSGHYGVVYDDAKDENECEQADQIDRYAKFRQQRNCAHEADRNSDAYPYRHREAEKQGQQYEYQQAALQSTFQKRIEAQLDDARTVAPKVQRYSGRHGSLIGFDIVLYRITHADRALLSHPVNLQQDRGPAVEQRVKGILLEGVMNGGNVTDRYAGAVRSPHHDDIFELGLDVSLSLGAQQNLAAGGFYRSGGQIHRRALDSVDQCVEGEPITVQRLFGYFYRNLVGPDGGQFDLCDLRQGDQFFSDSFAE